VAGYGIPITCSSHARLGAVQDMLRLTRQRRRVYAQSKGSEPDTAACAKLTRGVILRQEMLTIDAATIRRLTDLLVAAAKPNRIIMFGSQARGDAGEDSDLDVMVVEEGVSDRVGEMVRLSRLLRSFDIPVDLLVVSAEKFNYWCDTPGNVYFEAATEGKVLYEAA
jgi:predicted nucleotidyltransferase